MDYSQIISQELRLNKKQIDAVIRLLDEGSTVPFIARYRKEATGSLDEIMIQKIRDRLHQIKELEKRRESILQSIKEQGKLTAELKKKILNADTLSILEDIYLPYRPKKRTRASVAKEKGLEPFAKIIFSQKGVDVEKEGLKYIDKKKKVQSVKEAIDGARDIIAEWINEDHQAREQLRNLFKEEAVMTSKVIKAKEKEAQKFKDYFDWSESVAKAPSHRILAVRRGEKEAYLTVRVLPNEQKALDILIKLFVKGKGGDSQHVELALIDSYKRLLSLSLETELRLELKKRADEDAIIIFNNNLRQLLMAPPMGRKNVIAIDPGLRTGCKVVVLDQLGQLIDHDAIFLVTGEEKLKKAEKNIKSLIKKYQAEVIAIGNGTAARETERFIRSIKLPKEIIIVMVSETGASIYSASQVAREEFPDYDVTVRGSVSIGRRLMDPLAELVKIDPKSIGVGQYQHDVDQKLLKQNLDDVVMSCVNQVGVELNTASKQLLTYVSGLGPTRAQTIIDFRKNNGPFKSREQLLDISGLGPKAYEQAVGFLRIFDGANPLDSSAVHPESYPIVNQMAKDLKCQTSDLLNDEALRQKIILKNYLSKTVGMPTLQDIQNELAKPGRDPREPFQLFSFKDGVETINDLHPGMKLTGVVTNITAFGVFVDIGVHHDGLVHISELSKRYVKDPQDIVKVHQNIDVTVMEIDLERNRIALTVKGNA